LNKVIGFGGTDNIIFALERYLIEDRKERTAVLDVYRYLELDSESRIKLRALQTTTLNDSKKHATRLIKISEELQNDLVDIERKLASIPDEDAIAHLIAEREQARLALLKSQEKMSTIDAEIERNQRELDQKQAKLVSRIEQTVALEFEKEDIGRIINHSQRVRQTLNKFRESVLESHVNRIQRLVLDSFKQLLRKDSLVSDLRIDPRNFSLELRGPNSKILSPDRLSAGERQLLAVSMLWGLARASGRPLPTVIDTPLGRLDSTHRTHLIERYFPHASHQVLLLSTDKEIDKQYFTKLKKWIGRSYLLEFNDSRDATQVQKGYFW
jgi:DNA sulfur modification protein DndD